MRKARLDIAGIAGRPRCPPQRDDAGDASRDRVVDDDAASGLWADDDAGIIRSLAIYPLTDLPYTTSQPTHKGGAYRITAYRTPSWDEPEAYRTLVHEWGHYALELRDGYLEQRPLAFAGAAGPEGLLIRAQPGAAAPFTVIMPRITMHSESIMATTEGKSEFVTHTDGGDAKRKSEEWSISAHRYPWLATSAQSREGPGRLPLPLPRFQRLGALAGDGSVAARQPTAMLRAFPPKMQLDRCWVYVLPNVTGDRPVPERVIAQGTLEARSAESGFPLLGAGAGDTVVLIGRDRENYPAVFRGKIDVAMVGSQAQASVREWRNATPVAFPAVAVVPDLAEDDTKVARISVHLDSAGGPLPEQVWVLPLGQSRAQDAIGLGRPDRHAWISEAHKVPTLDGNVLLRWQDGTLMISSFSQGGSGPNSSYPFPANPLNAGSSDGHAALYSFDDARAGAYAADPSTYTTRRLPQADYSGIKLITTVGYDVPGKLPPGGHARSYVFSMASNAPLPLRITPTLALYYDALFTLPDERELLLGDLRIYRLEGGAWRPLPTYLPSGYPFAVAPLDEQTGGSLIAAEAPGPRVEHYRIFWTPRAVQATIIG